jgi:hypothetical protein
MKFNSLKYSKKLRLAGFNENQSAVLAEGFHEHISYQEVAKKSDLVHLDKKIDVVEIRLEKSIADLGTKLTTFICASSFSVMTILLAFMMFLHSGK